MISKAIRTILLFSIVPAIAFADSTAPNSNDTNGADIDNVFIDTFEETQKTTPDKAIGAADDLKEPEQSSILRMPETSVRPLPSDQPAAPAIPEQAPDQPGATSEGITSLKRAEQAINVLTHENALLQRRLNNLNQQMSYLRRTFEKSNAALFKRIDELQSDDAVISRVALSDNASEVPVSPENNLNQQYAAAVKDDSADDITLESSSSDLGSQSYIPPLQDAQPAPATESEQTDTVDVDLDLPEPLSSNGVDDEDGVTLESSSSDPGSQSYIPPLQDAQSAPATESEQADTVDVDLNLSEPLSSNDVDDEDILQAVQLQLFDMSSLLNTNVIAQNVSETQTAGTAGQAGAANAIDEKVDDVLKDPNFVLQLGIGLAAVGLLLLLFVLKSGPKKPKRQPREELIEETNSIENDGFETTTFEPEYTEEESFDDFTADAHTDVSTESIAAESFDTEEMPEEIIEPEIDSPEMVVDTVLETESKEAIPEIEIEAALEAEAEAEETFEAEEAVEVAAEEETEKMEEDESEESFLISDEEFDSEDLEMAADIETEEDKKGLESGKIAEPPKPPEYDFSEQVEDNASIKLDLARAYLEMQDYDAAEEVLHGVIKEGSKLQQKEAQALMDKLNADRG